MLEKEIKYSITPGPECRRCPNGIRTEDVKDPNDTFAECPRNKVLIQVGPYATLQKLEKSAGKHGLIFKGQLIGRKADLTPMFIYTCPNNENDKLTGNIMLERPLMS